MIGRQTSHRGFIQKTGRNLSSEYKLRAEDFAYKREKPLKRDGEAKERKWLDTQSVS